MQRLAAPQLLPRHQQQGLGCSACCAARAQPRLGLPAAAPCLTLLLLLPPACPQNEADAYRNIKLRVEDVQGRNCLTQFHVSAPRHPLGVLAGCGKWDA